MAQPRILDDDIIRLYDLGKPRKVENLIATLFWGDTVNVVDKQDGAYVIELWRRVWDDIIRHYVWEKRTGILPSKTRFRDTPLLKVRFLDVGQGDAAIVESPQGRIVLIDGGEEEHLRRYINVAYSHILRKNPLHCDALVVTHGDADHFAGLTKLIEGFRNSNPKSPLITADRVFHNGLVKKNDERISEAFGATVKIDGVTYAVQLEDNLIDVPDERMNRPFKSWKAALKKLEGDSGNLIIRRLQYGDGGAFDFLLAEEIAMKVLGPIVEEVQGETALRFLRSPEGGRGLSISHTINGHSIVLKLTYHNINFLFGADMNEESEERLIERAKKDHLSLVGEVFKVPHHGSADFSPTMLEEVSPVVSVVSSGDECTSKDYIHPRAGLMGALGKYSRASVTKPLVYATEMVAFFKRLGEIEATQITPSGGQGKPLNRIHNAYTKTTFGIVHIRTDGERVFVATHSGKDDQKESYAFHVDRQGEITFEKETRIN